MVGLGRVELPTSPLSGVRSNQLSYRPVSYRPVLDRPLSGEPGGSRLNLTHSQKGFEDMVERTGKLRFP
jgi:hypothetical protein